MPRTVPTSLRYGKYSVTGLTRLTAPGGRCICPIIDTTASGDHIFRAIPALPSCMGTVFVPLHVLLPERSKHRPALSIEEVASACRDRFTRVGNPPGSGAKSNSTRAWTCPSNRQCDRRRGYIAQKACEHIKTKRCRGSREKRLRGTP